MEKEKTKKTLSDLIFSLIGIVAFNGILQLCVYPYLAEELGDKGFGNAQTLFAVISVLATTFGTGANYARMVAETKGRNKEGDYNLFLIASCIVSVIIVCIASFFIGLGTGFVFLLMTSLLTVFSVTRYYGDVEYKLNVNYKRFCIYYLLLAGGYLVGWLLFKYGISFIKGKGVVDSLWPLIILLGEAATFIYVFAKGKIFRGKDALKKSSYFGENMKSIMFLLFTNLINALLLHADKILLRIFESPESVSVFYVATLIGKIVALVTVPLNSLIIGYLAKYEGKFTRKFFTVCTAAALAAGVLFLGVCMLGSYVFVWWKYPQLYDQAKPLFLLANAGQILYFISCTMMIIVLRFMHEKYQLIINAAYICLFIAVAIPSVLYGHLWGMAWSLFAVNLVRLIAVIAMGYIFIKKQNKSVDN